MLTRSCVYHDPAKFAFSGLQNARNEVTRIVFWSPQNADKGLTRPSHHVPMNRGFNDPPKIAPCVLWLRRNRIFRTPKCRKGTHTKVCSLKPWVSRLGKIAFSGHKNEENQLKLREVPLNSGLHDSAKFVFSCPQNAVNVLTRKYVPLNRLFNESAEIAF